ncbi:MAG: universal stress protein [Desulfobacterales bacterium]|nr:MAG: universal stress protein [Desulfobacterales bacterium]
MKLLAYTDGRPNSAKALRFAAELKTRLGAELAVITVRPGTSAIETPPPLGEEIPLHRRTDLPPGLQILAAAVDELTAGSLLDRPQAITIRELRHGHLFVCKTPSGERVPFYECFGHFTEMLNYEIDQHRYDLLIIAPPRRNRVQRVVLGDTNRKLALDLHTSVLIVRGGGPNSRFLVCSDGSASGRRPFPLLKLLLPAIRPPIELLWARRSDTALEDVQRAEECLQLAQQWLQACGKESLATQLQGDQVVDLILATAGSDAVVLMGASLRHDVIRRTRGSLPMKVLARTESSVLLAKLPPEADTGLFKDPFTC